MTERPERNFPREECVSAGREDAVSSLRSDYDALSQQYSRARTQAEKDFLRRKMEGISRLLSDFERESADCRSDAFSRRDRVFQDSAERVPPAPPVRILKAGLDFDPAFGFADGKYVLVPSDAFAEPSDIDETDRYYMDKGYAPVKLTFRHERKRQFETSKTLFLRYDERLGNLHAVFDGHSMEIPIPAAGSAIRREGRRGPGGHYVETEREIPSTVEFEIGPKRSRLRITLDVSRLR